MLVPELDTRTNLWRIVRREETGMIPFELDGLYTKKDLAQRAIDQYECASALKSEAKASRAVDRELWAKAKAMKGMPTKQAYEMLKAQQETEIEQ